MPTSAPGRFLRDMTEAETAFWQMLRSVNRRVPISPSGADRTVHRGFSLPRTRLIVEIDGGQQDPLSEREATHARFPKGEAYA
jgi:very-short-patch-repair endonuclease